MNDQNAPLWRNGQVPSSSTESNQTGSQNDAEQQAKKQNDKSAKRKRSH